MADYHHYIQEFEELAEWEEVIERWTLKFVERADPFAVYSDKDFVERYRLSKVCVHHLLEKIQEQLPTSNNRRRLQISPELLLLVTLKYFAIGNYQLTQGDCTDMSQPSVCTATASLAPEYIQFPSPATEEEVMQQFSNIAGMPGVIGCVDDTHIPIKSPGGVSAEIYRCRKGYFSINVMRLCDASLKFTNIAVNWPGSAHDSRIFNESRLCDDLEEGRYRGFLLGDSEYACQSYLLTPYLIPHTEKQVRYSAAHVKTRNVIE
ncbi:putative nuclease HARBI1 [Portunus trituberculatus]|uniref:putative nuclease HARBI1 n=1 Tax=Portunus trituberculatus TaxID=210409 RepID=UPI001E1CE751|nr:putative nuclease HARBI1 [Portunus trituberculatus]